MSHGSDAALIGVKRSVHLDDDSSLDSYRLETENMFDIGDMKREV
jgi:hypothetical protein